ncbi:fimbrial protein [Yersinia hibernica]|uniref:Type 1 fimbrial protein n=2 Tax=Yersinia TaxID=629 RepID=A0ABX5R1G5_9GAMM|nr:fimbrial protein [Yersinia hibernica]AHM72764.2 type 1 fimbrial protein [Yersinia hibernica]OVZ75350.1 hypothetical protein CBW54_22275 [Yersinia kristensenii]QAX79452.1 type 1 fimbrial protein [Yersinia hibernica]
MSNGASFVMSSLLVWLVLPVAVFGVLAMDASGKLSMQDSVIDTPCAIDAAGREQAIDLITLSLEQITRDGEPSKPFSIHLENCAFHELNPDKQGGAHFMVTFDGLIMDGGLFALHGGARGIGLDISNAIGNRAMHF